MDGELREILIENAKEYYGNAIKAEEKGEHNSAVTLFFKTLSALCDLYVLKKEGRIPTSHTERFRILETKYPEIYKILDKDFPFYQDSYKARMDKEVSEMLKEDVKKLFKILGIGM